MQIWSIWQYKSALVVLLYDFKSRSGFLDIPGALFGRLHRLICHLKLCSDIMYSRYSSSYQYCLRKFLPVCLLSPMHSCIVYSATAAPQMSFSCVCLIYCMCCGECKIKNSHRSGERLHSRMPLHSLPYFLKIKLYGNVTLCQTWATTCVHSFSWQFWNTHVAKLKHRTGCGWGTL